MTRGGGGIVVDAGVDGDDVAAVVVAGGGVGQDGGAGSVVASDAADLVGADGIVGVVELGTTHIAVGGDMTKDVVAPALGAAVAVGLAGFTVLSAKG